ncbi:MAG TPA: acetyl-CoA carboxylase biotin carboxyl carrier protein [candidate division Zixibacteria bacterium]
MNERKIRKLIKLVEESNIGELEVSSWGRMVRIRKKVAEAENSATAAIPTITVSPPVNNPAPQVAPEPTAETKKEEIPANLVPIKSPMVGTFYRAPAPGAKLYTDVGQIITVGQVVCIIEAMKLMNEIESEISGKVVKILVENAKPVEFGQTLFLIEPA